MTKEEVITAIHECVERLGHVPSYTELMRETGISRRQIRRHFGKYARGLKECGLERSGGGWKVPLERLLDDWVSVVRTLKKLPSISEYEQLSQHTAGPLSRRFGSWTQIPTGLKQYMEEKGRIEEYTDVVVLIEAATVIGPGRAKLSWPATASSTGPRIFEDRPIYGPPMRPYPLAHGPSNEGGVIFLFGAKAEELGFVVTLIQSGYPDCEAMRRIEEDKWQRIRIEFEYESRNFLKHMHEVSECDMIVCWKHNWPECPLEVVELRKVVQ